MAKKRGVAGLAILTAVVAMVGTLASTALADENYTPTTLGNSAYTNHVDLRNDIYVDGINFIGPIAAQNAESVDQAEAAGVTIGTKGADSSPILVTNMLGQEIKSFAISTKADGTGFGSNLMSGSLAVGGQACWYFDYEYQLISFTNHDGHSYETPVTFTIAATLADGTVAEFHNLNLNGVRTINLRYSKDYGVYYAERTTITNHTPDPNLYYEVNRTEYEGGDEEFAWHVNSAIALDRRQITAARGTGAWMLPKTPVFTAIEIFAADIPLYGTSEGDYTNGLYDNLHWNSDTLTWRANDYDVRDTLDD